MLIIGITGGIGSGKTTVANLFANRNVPIIEADVIARALTEPNKPAYVAIVDRFQEKVLAPNHEIDRARLRRLIFANTKDRIWLENLLHPLIITEMQNEIKQLFAPYCILVIPLLFEAGPLPFIDRILVVDAPEEVQIERVTQRDENHPAMIQAILDVQVDRERRLEQADDLIINDGLLVDLELQVDKLHKFYLLLAEKKGGK